jgi:hypothetical protein
VHEVLRSPGQPLDAQTRAFMDPRFGHDFSSVRLHTDEKAAESAQAVSALAYTVGHDIVFAAGQYHPNGSAGKSLMAHELTHVVQQEKESGGSTPALAGHDASYEQEADSMSRSIVSGARGDVRQTAERASLQRSIDPRPCLNDVYTKGVDATFGTPNFSGGFVLWYYNQTHQPVPSNLWDGFGHCWIACEGAKHCGSATTLVAGKAREFYRQYLDSKPHDSYEQDTNNQTLGRGYAKAGADCTVACQAAALPGGALDRSAPQVELWTPQRGRYPAPPSAAPAAGVTPPSPPAPGGSPSTPPTK